MNLCFKKMMIWLLVICFAWLQLLSPLLHAHSSASAQEASVGVHFHVNFLPATPDITPMLKNMSVDGDVVGVENSVIRDQALLTLVAIFAMLFVLLVIANTRIIFPVVTNHLTPLNLRHTSLTPRAPPYF